MRRHLPGIAIGLGTAYAIGAVASVTATVNGPTMHGGEMTRQRITAGAALAVLWPYQAYMAVSEWNP